MKGRALLWPVAIRRYFTPTPSLLSRATISINKEPVRQPKPVTNAITKEISFTHALALVAECQETMTDIERMRGLRIPLTRTMLQIDRPQGANRRKRVFRLYGPAVEVQALTARPEAA